MNNNRYAAPAAAVADVDEAVVAERPRQVIIGVWLLWIELVIGLPGMVNQQIHPDRELPEGQIRTVFLVVMGVIMAGSVVLYAWLNWKCWFGRNWARIVHLVFLGIGLLLIYWAMPAVFAKSTVQGVLYIVQTVLNIAGVVLLFTPPASAWYKVLREARR